MFIQSLVNEEIDECSLFECIKSIEVTEQDFINFLNTAQTDLCTI